MRVPIGHDRSRSDTIISSLKRLSNGVYPDVLILHIAGADSQEQTFIQQTFASLFQFVDGLMNRIHLVFIGPNLAQQNSIQLIHNSQSGTVLTIIIDFIVGIYNIDAMLNYDKPHAVYMFQAGIWAYDSWKESVQFARQNTLLGLVITAYNFEECEGDEDRLVEWGYTSDDWIWTTEYNPYCSDISLPSPDIPSRYLTENQYWQALAPTFSY